MSFQQKHWALGALVEDVFGPFSTDILGDDDSTHTRAVGNWYRLNYILVTESDAKKIQDRMSEWHRMSFSLLYEWWTASYQDPAFSLAAILRILERCRDMESSKQENGGFSENQWRVILQRLKLKQWPDGKVEEPDNDPESIKDSTHYHESVRWLFACEFGFSGNYEPLKEGTSERKTRRFARQRAARLAYCQQLGWNLYHDLKPQRSQLTSSDDPVDIKNVLESTIDDPTGGSWLPRHKKSPNSLLAHGPIIETCEWLENDIDEFNNLPHFLWDVKNARTVETAALKFHPQYTAISHTWGRWTKEKPIEINGVPWKVPQNTRFEVQNLPEILSRVPCETPFVWLDLVCIPQDGSRTGTQEIARQAKIFKGAQHVVAWLNDVDDFEGLGYVIKWQVLYLLQFQSERTSAQYEESIQEAWKNMSGRVSNLTEPRAGKSFSERNRLNPWFTSLWTLQEVSLRPDMWLCSKNWGYLTTDGTTPLPLSGFLAVVETFASRDMRRVQADLKCELDVGNESHIAVFELIHWRLNSGLCQVLDLDRVSLISLGDRRECTERRAEAIMSALGVTDWYNQELEKVKPGHEAEFRASLERDLVLGKYPLRFVHELCQKIPGDFFGALRRFNIGIEAESITFPVSAGSLLPFSSTQSYYVNGCGLRSLGIPPTTHKSVLTWRVLPTGQVSMPQACVVSSPSVRNETGELPIVPMRLAAEGHGAPLPSDFKSIVAGLSKYGPEWANLHSWTRNQLLDTYAILIHYRNAPTIPGGSVKIIQASGVMVQRTTSGSLIKKSHFAINDESFSIDLERCETLNWIVD